MANWNTLKAAVADAISTNGNQEITGQILQNVLNSIITNVGENATFVGVATPETNPGTPDGPVFYLTATAGTYPNFNGIEVQDGEAVILLWDNNAWSKKVTGFATQEKLSQLGSKLLYTDIDSSKVSFTVRQFVDSRTGKAVWESTTANPMVAMSSFVKIEGSTGVIVNAVISPNNTKFYGWAFYTEANESSYIEGSSDRRYIEGSDWANDSVMLEVPEGAKYVRFTMLEDTNTYGDWTLKRDVRIDNIEDSLNNVSEEVNICNLGISKSARITKTVRYKSYIAEVADSTHINISVKIDEVAEDSEATFAEIKYCDGVDMFDANGVLSGKLRYNASLKSVVIPAGTTRIVFNVRTAQGYTTDSVLSINVTGLFGESESSIFRNTSMSVVDGVPTYNYYAGNCALHRMMLKGNENGTYIYINTSYGFSYRETVFAFYNKDGELISIENYPSNSASFKEYRVGLSGFAISIPKGCKYIYTKYYNWDCVVESDVYSELFSYEDVNIITRKPYVIWIFGDSISASGYHVSVNPLASVGALGGWISPFLQKVITRPDSVVNYSVGGYTLTDNTGDNSGNSYLKRVDDAIEDQKNGLINKPDIVLVVGCTNDIGDAVERYITDAELNGEDYNDYAERNWFTGGTVDYNHYALIPLNDINKGKIIGALRYIVEKIGTEYADAKFLFVTPPQSTRKYLSEQRKCVRDMMWAAERLCVPIANVWGDAQMPMLWDYNADWGADGLNHRFLDDGIHTYDAGTEDGITGYIRQGEYIARIFNYYFLQ